MWLMGPGHNDLHEMLLEGNASLDLTGTKEPTQNLIRFGQTTINRKSNADTKNIQLTSCSLPGPSPVYMARLFRV